MADEKSEPVDMPRGTADPIKAGEPVEGTPGLSQLGATFAERSGKPAPDGAGVANSTFADRAKAGKQADDQTDDDEGSDSKAIQEDAAENKAMTKKAASRKG